MNSSFIKIIKNILIYLGIISLTVSNAYSNKSKPTIDVGAVFAMTGPTATFGQESISGIKLALKTINKEGIAGRKIRLILEDNKGEPLESANAVRKLIDMDKVSVVLGAVASSNTLAGAPIAQKAKVPLLTPSSTNPKVTMMGDYISRACFTDDFQGVVMAKFAKETLKKSRAAIIVDNANDYSKGLAKVFRQKFQEFGGTIVSKDDFAYQQKDVDFRSILRRVKRKKPDVIFVPGYYTEVGLILKQAHQMRFNVPFLGGDGWDSPKLQQLAGKEAITGHYLSSHFSPDDSSPKVQNFVKEFKKEYNERPGAMAALGYDATFILANALKNAKNLSREEIKVAINNTKNFSAITGNITINKNRNAVKSAVVLKTTPAGNVFVQKVDP
ncbi:MAG: ABC transporter substrate-binding protein [Bacteriovoracaceae bacterium]|nr:ABC transporter substrate-binding protein [Bacteriovoracaceae bacterium]